MFLKSISDKLKAIYILWIFINTILFAFGYGNRPEKDIGDFGESEYIKYWDLKHFYPFDTGTGDILYHSFSSKALGTYDYTEFLIYTLTPLVLCYAVWLFLRKPKKD